MIIQDTICLESRSTQPGWLLRPTILPDELAHSYAHRVLILNSVDSLGSLLATLANSGVIKPKTSPLELLAWIAGVDVSEFVRGHTLIPFLRAFSLDARPRPHGEGPGIIWRQVAFRVNIRNFRCCVSCMREDLEFWGFPIMRVSHHVPGIDCCGKHSLTLISTGFASCKSPCIKKFSWSTILPPMPELSTQLNEITQRYAEIAAALMARTAPIPITVVSQVIVSRARQRGLRRAIYGKRKNLSDLALETAPRNWLEQLLPGFLDKKTEFGVFTTSLDATLNPRVACRPEAYAIALAVLFSQSDEALGELTFALREALTRISRPPTATFRPLKPAAEISRLEIAKIYVKSNFNCTEMGKAMSRSHTRAGQLVARFGFPPSRLIHPRRNQAALIAYAQGADIKTACSSSGASVTEFNRLLQFDLDLIAPLMCNDRLMRLFQSVEI